MAYDENLADRLRMTLKEKRVAYLEKKMMGGLCFMVDDKMCVGIIKNNLMARIDPGIYEEAITRPGCKPMDFTGRPMKGFVFIEPYGIDMDEDLDHWVQLCLDFNPKAKAGKKKRS
ncbi:TfoX family protein [Marinilabiliaceae bacterium JC017]|nr:TfoX family protein [Marinilabiliaceae bacterium JC017]